MEQDTPPGRQFKPSPFKSSLPALQNYRHWGVLLTFIHATAKGLCLPWASHQLPFLSRFDQLWVLTVFRLAAFSAAKQWQRKSVSLTHTEFICLSQGLTQCTWTAKGERFTNNYCTHWISRHVWWGLQGQWRKRDSICKAKGKEWKLQKTKRGWHWLPYEWFQLFNSIPGGASAILTVHQPLQHPYHGSQPRLQLNSQQICKNEDCHLPSAG